MDRLLLDNVKTFGLSKKYSWLHKVRSDYAITIDKIKGAFIENAILFKHVDDLGGYPTYLIHTCAVASKHACRCHSIKNDLIVSKEPRINN